MILLFEFRCKGTTFFSNIQKSRAEKELFYLYSLYIVRCSIVSYIELSVTEHLYSLSLGEGWGEVCVLSFFKTDGHITNSKHLSQTGRVVYCAEAGIGIRGVESLVEEDHTVVAVQH